MNIPTPYHVFLGDPRDFKQAKVAHGVVEWRPELCVGQYSLPSCEVDLNLPVMTPKQAVKAGAKTFLIGISPFTTSLPDSYREIIREAMSVGLNIASPLHEALDDELEFYAAACGVKIYNFRHRPDVYPKGTGEVREGMRLLTVGTDCACGKKFTALSLSRAMTAAKIPNTFRSTGQTGFLISQSGINNDTIEADFLSGAAEWLSPVNDANHWDVIEGQGALSHPSFGGGSLSLIYGSQPDVIVMCTEPGRLTQRGVKMAPLSLVEEIEYVLTVARRTNPNVRLGAISLFTKYLDEAQREQAFADVIAQFPNIFVFDPARPSEDFRNFVNYLLTVQAEV